MKKIFICFLFSLLFLAGCGSESYDYNKVDNGYEISGYTGSKDSITIPENYNNLPVIGIGENAFRDSKIKSVKLSSNIEYIGKNAFSNSVSLTSVKMNSSLKKIDSYSFFGCTSLNNIKIPDSVEYVGTNAFYNTRWYNNQTDILYIDNILIGYKDKLDDNYNLIINDGTRLVAESAFERPATAYTSGIVSISIPDSLEIINDRAFFNAGKLSILNLKEVSSIGEYAFSSTLNTSSFSVNAEKIGAYAFYECRIIAFELGSNVKYIGEHAFDHSWSDINDMESLTIPEGVLEIYDFAFAGYQDLEIINLSSSEFSEKWNYFDKTTQYITRKDFS